MLTYRVKPREETDNACGSASSQSHTVMEKILPYIHIPQHQRVSRIEYRMYYEDPDVFRYAGPPATQVAPVTQQCEWALRHLNRTIKTFTYTKARVWKEEDISRTDSYDN